MADREIENQSKYAFICFCDIHQVFCRHFCFKIGKHRYKIRRCLPHTTALYTSNATVTSWKGCYLKNMTCISTRTMTKLEPRTYRRACPEGTRVSDGGRVAEGQGSKGQRHHGAAEQQLQQAERQQRPSGQQQPRPTGSDPG